MTTRYSTVEYANKTFRIKKTNFFMFKQWMNLVINTVYDADGNVISVEPHTYVWGSDEPGSMIMSRSIDGKVSLRWGVATFKTYEEADAVLKKEAYPNIAVREIPLATMRDGIPDAITSERILREE